MSIPMNIPLSVDGGLSVPLTVGEAVVTDPIVDPTLTISGAAADAKVTGDEIRNLKSAFDLGCITAELKTALLQLASKVAYIDDDGQDYYDDLYAALYYRYWTVTNTLTHCTTSNASVQTIKGNPYTATITPSVGYVMTGATVSITMGGVDITATAYSNGVISIPAVTGALVITISAAAKTVSSISAVYTQSGTVYDTDTLDSLKSDLVVTATYDDSSTAVVPAADYTLSGTLTAGTSTVTVNCGGKTTTFSVTVTCFFERGRVVQRNTASATPKSGAYKLTYDSPGRAVGHEPIENNNNTYTVTDSTLYEMNVVPITSDEKKYTSVPSAAVDGYWYQSNTDAVSWGTTFTRTTPFVWVVIRRKDNVDFTDAELTNGAAAVFTVT